MAFRKHRSDHTIIDHLAAGANHGLRYLTAKDGDSLAQNVPLLYDSNGNVISTATRTGNTTNFATATAGSKTSGNYPKWDGNGNLTDGDTGSGSSGLTNPPPSTGWTWNNQQTATAAFASDGALDLVANGVSAVNILNVYYRTAPSVPYVVTIGLRAQLFSGGLPSVMVGWRQSSDGKLVVVRLNGNRQIGIHKFTNSSTYAGTSYLADATHFTLGDEVFITLTDNNTNRIVSSECDAIQKPAIHTVGRTDFLTADQVFVAVDSGGATAGSNYAHLKVRYWDEA